MLPPYDPAAVEAQAQAHWAQTRRFEVREDPAREKFYCLCMFPYPSGALHMGHVRNYTIGDVVARYQLMQGKNVLQPMGWDAFGMPAENAAIQKGIAPSRWTYENIAHMRAQLERLGFGYDWSRELTACKPEYYRWEQWLFTRLLRKGLAYRRQAVVNWDPVDQTVLANEQVIEGRGWRSGALVERREIPQWFLRITDYADDLLEGLDTLDGWPERVKTMQRNWIGRSEGLELEFEVEGHAPLTVFTTRPDTLFGVTYLAVAPEHPLALEAGARDSALAAFLEEAVRGGVAEAELETMEKRGMPLGIHARHPLSGERLPVWVANFVLMSYGTGAVMAVPAHDERDHEFARKYGLPIRRVIRTAQEAALEARLAAAAPAERAALEAQLRALRAACTTERGTLVSSPGYDGLDFTQACAAFARHFEATGRGRRRVLYRLRDWGVSRQRYWGCPIPVIHCEHCGAVPVPDADLPVLLPEDVVVDGAGSPLARMPEFYETTCPQCGGPARRETDTFDTFVESSWYFARFACPDQHARMLDERVRYWLPVDQYIGGIEHAILHLLYARFFTRVLHDEGLVPVREPFTRLLTQGMVLKDGAKMSKSRGNTVDPQALVDRYGADTARLFIMFAAPPEAALEWSDEAVAGAHRFLRRLWGFAGEYAAWAARAPAADPGALDAPQREARRELHALLRQANHDYARGQFNTVVSAAMKMLNELARLPVPAPPAGGGHRALVEEGLAVLLRLLAPIVPHITHALWRALDLGTDVLDAPWPQADEAALARATLTLAVQVNGKLRATVDVPADADPPAIEAAVLADERVRRHLEGKSPRRVVQVPGKLVNVVV